MDKDGRFQLDNYLLDVPQERIATHPSQRRGDSRLMVVQRPSKDTPLKITHTVFSDIGAYLNAGDLLVLNDTRVLPCRLPLKKPDGAAVEGLFVPVSQERWPLDKALPEIQQLFPQPIGKGDCSVWLLLARGVKPGTPLRAAMFDCYPGPRQDDGALLTLIESSRNGIETGLAEHGKMPLPPYILKRRGESREWQHDGERYQTVYASGPANSVAAPTAGLHFTTELLSQLTAKGIDQCRVTLHVGRGTFQPIVVDDVRDHKMGSEWYSIPEASRAAIGRCRDRSHRVVAVGTTVVRALESAARYGREHGDTELFLFPETATGGSIRSTDAMLTNFHLPGSSLLLLVMAFAGEATIREAYKIAVELEYNFYSYGDAMLIL